MDLAAHRQSVKARGYAIVREALTADEVGQLRFAVGRYLEQPGAARYVFGGRVNRNPFVLAPDEIGRLVGHPVLAGVLKAIAGTPIVFAREVGLAQNMKSGWHKDMRGLDTSTDEGQEPGLFKVLLYLQDHLGLSEGDFALKVRTGSHLMNGIDDGPEERLFTRAGDAIIMDCRITHRGQNESSSNLLARVGIGGVRRLAGDRAEYFVTQRIRHAFGRADRQLVTILYGRRNRWTDEYMKNSRETELARTPDLETDLPLPPAWREALQSVEIGF